MPEKLSNEALTARLRDVEENVRVIRETIAEAALRAGRSPEDVILMAVTKTVPVEVINHALSLGIDYMGENRVQELNEKYDALRKDGKHIHLIGHRFPQPRTWHCHKRAGGSQYRQGAEQIRCAA